jgi:hypothetical protein
VSQSIEPAVRLANSSLPIAIAQSLALLRETRIRSSRLMSEGVTVAAVNRQLWLHDKMLRHLGEIGCHLAEMAGSRGKRGH